MTAEQSEFLKSRVVAAQYGQRTYGVPASVTLAQAILESGWGKSDLASQCNNDFGIKAGAHATPDTYKEFPTTEFVNGVPRHVMAQFVRYPSLTLGFGAHTRLLAMAPRYKPAMSVRNSPIAFAYQLQHCGYSTNPQYGATLAQLISEYDLTQYDLQPEPPAQEEKIAA